MNEAELHVLKGRMYQGKLNKARRGELFGTPPIGYIRLTTGEWALDPDEQVQAVVRLIFDQFDREATLHGLLRYLVHHQVRIPVRAAGGPSKGQLEWRRPNRATLQNLLRHPSYAGAYRFGHRPVDPRKKQPGRPTTGKLIRRPEDCLVLIRDRLPAYITWDRFEANQDRLRANRSLPTTAGAPRKGSAMLSGLVRCGRCGRRMVVRYPGPPSRPSYTCTRGAATYGEPICQGLSHGAARANRSYSSARSRCCFSASSHRRSSSRATSRFSGSHAWYWRAARSTSMAARSRFNCHCRANSARCRSTPATAARLAASAAGSTAARSCRATSSSRVVPCDNPWQIGSPYVAAPRVQV